MKFKLITFLAFAGIMLSACGGSQAVAVPDTLPADFAGKANPLSPDASTQGAVVFQNNCAACHGPEGHGDGPAGQALDPKPKNLAELQTTTQDDYFFWRVSAGKPGTSMVAWQGVLTDEQIWQVIAFIRTLK